MKLIKTDIPGLLVIQPQIMGDHRGWFMESWSQQKFADLGINIVFVQDNHSCSSQKGTLRGLHFQLHPMSQTKLIRCTRGSIMDVAVDLRKGSPGYLKWHSIELSEQNKRLFLVPKGFAHGFLTLTDNAEVQYKVDSLYSKEHDRSIRFDDPQININWGVNEPILSDKDINAPLLKDSDANFIYKK
jgi:dTDP-4-dehydrorhamnose 3,5-epimerase